MGEHGESMEVGEDEWKSPGFKHASLFRSNDDPRKSLNYMYHASLRLLPDGEPVAISAEIGKSCMPAEM